MKASAQLRTAALLGFAAVALGAFGAHGLQTTLAQHQAEEIWKTASIYHLAHSIVLLLLALHPSRHKGAFAFFVTGISLFSGSLYLLAITGIRWLGLVTPIGGTLLLVGWLALAFWSKPTDS